MQIAAGEQLRKIATDLRALARSYSKGTFLRSNEQPFWREIKPFYGCAAEFAASHARMAGADTCGCSVEAVGFPNEAGQVLFGTLHRARRAQGRLAGRIAAVSRREDAGGPGRLYVPLTEMLNALGYTVLRFDFFGLGDSEGELQRDMLADVYNNIEVGRYVDDTLSAMQWLRKTHGFERFMLGGLVRRSHHCAAGGANAIRASRACCRSG